MGNILLILFFLFCLVTQQWDFFLIAVTLWGLVTWIFRGVSFNIKLPRNIVKENIVKEKPLKENIVKEKSWLDFVAANAVHILIVGETNSGKSITAKAILAERAKMNEYIIILDPHAQPKTWNFLPSIGKGRNYQEIEMYLRFIIDEMNKRYELYSNDDLYNPIRLNVFIDEVPSIAQHCDSWQEFFTTLSCESRKVNISLVCLTQSRLVDILNIKGKSDIRENFTEILLGDKAIKALPDAKDQNRPAVLDNGKMQLIDVSLLPKIASVDLSHNVIWTPKVGTDKATERQTNGLLPEWQSHSCLFAELSDEEKQLVNDWQDQALSRREMARRLYTMRGGTSSAYDGSGPLFTVVKTYLDSNP